MALKSLKTNTLNTTENIGIQPNLIDAKGDLLVGTANDVVNRLAVGINGQVLVADSSETTGLKWNNQNSGGLALINTTTFTSISTGVIVDNCFSSTYRNYRLLLTLTASAPAETALQFRIGGSTTGGTSYRFQIFKATNTSLSGAQNVSAALITIGASRQTEASHIVVDISRPNEALPTIVLSTGHYPDGGNVATWTTTGRQVDNTQFDGFIITGGTITGTVSTYGWTK
jgi:hypothetical protein